MSGVEVASSIKSCIISRKGGVPINEINDEYQELIGECIPFSKLGYASLEEYLLSLAGIRLSRSQNGGTVLTVHDEKTAHLAALVAKQKPNPVKAKKKKPVSTGKMWRQKQRLQTYDKSPMNQIHSKENSNYRMVPSEQHIVMERRTSNPSNYRQPLHQHNNRKIDKTVAVKNGQWLDAPGSSKDICNSHYTSTGSNDNFSAARSSSKQPLLKSNSRKANSPVAERNEQSLRSVQHNSTAVHPKPRQLFNDTKSQVGKIYDQYKSFEHSSPMKHWRQHNSRKSPVDEKNEQNTQHVQNKASSHSNSKQRNYRKSPEVQQLQQHNGKKSPEVQQFQQHNGRKSPEVQQLQQHNGRKSPGSQKLQQHNGRKSPGSQRFQQCNGRNSPVDERNDQSLKVLHKKFSVHLTHKKQLQERDGRKSPDDKREGLQSVVHRCSDDVFNIPLPERHWTSDEFALHSREEHTWQSHSARKVMMLGKTLTVTVADTKVLTYPKFLNCQLLGDDFLLHFAFRTLRYSCCDWRSGVLYKCGLCVSGQTIRDCWQRVIRTSLLADNVLLLLGAADVMEGNPLLEMKSDMIELLDVLEHKVDNVVILTVPPLVYLWHHHDVRKVVVEFNKWLKNLHTGVKFHVLDIWPLFAYNRNDICMEYFQSYTSSLTDRNGAVVLWNQLGMEVLMGFLSRELAT